MTSPHAVNADVNLLMLKLAVESRPLTDQTKFLCDVVAALCTHVDEMTFAEAIYTAKCVHGGDEVIQ